MNEKAVILEDVSMRFNLSRERVDNLKEYVIRGLKRDLHFDEFYALKNISLEIKKGESFAIIGRNGSGKSTLLKVIAGIFKPTYGKVTIHGSMAPLIELGAGFDPELTARENIYLNGAVLGFSKKFMMGKFDEIIDFSELGDFVDVPIKNYSSGMAARLGFSIATIVNPDILIVDEVLSVGDFAFQKKCQKKMQAMLSGNTTLLFVSHSTDLVKSLCQRALWLDHGVQVSVGEAGIVCTAYTENP